MCNAIKDGGRRCQGHARSAASRSIAAIASVIGGGSVRDAEAEIKRLRAASADHEAADRAEIDAFLESQIEQAETIDVTPRRRATILGHLKAAIGHLKVDRATLHAWREVVARAVLTSRRRIGAVMLATVIATGTGACGAGAGPGGHSPEPTSSLTQQATEVAEFSSPISPPTVPEDVAAHFGSAGKADAAFTQIWSAHADTMFNNDLLVSDLGSVKPSDFPMRAQMTTEFQKWFDDNLAAASTDSKAAKKVNYLAVISPNLGSDGLRTGVPHLAVQKKISSARWSMDTDGRARSTATFTGALRLTLADGSNVLSPFSATTTYWVEKTGKVSGYETTWHETGEETPDRW